MQKQYGCTSQAKVVTLGINLLHASRNAQWLHLPVDFELKSSTVSEITMLYNEKNDLLYNLNDAEKHTIQPNDMKKQGGKSNATS